MALVICTYVDGGAVHDQLDVLVHVRLTTGIDPPENIPIVMNEVGRDVDAMLRHRYLPTRP